MSLIPWIVDGDSPTVVTNPTAFDINGHAILMKELKRDEFGKDTYGRPKPNGSYDLHVGGEYRDHRRLESNQLTPKNTIELPQKTAMTITADEEVQFPISIFGLIVPKETLLQKGLSNWPTKVDPGYNGPLHIAVFNHGNQSVELTHNEAFCALLLFSVAPPADAYNKKAKLLTRKDLGERPKKQFLRFLKTHWQWIVASLISIAYVIVSIVAIVLSRGQ